MDYPPGVQEYIRRGKEMEQARTAQRARMRQKKFDTIAVHGVYGMEEALNNQGSIIEPAYLSNSQHFENSDHLEAGLAYLTPAWIYSRFANPTLDYLEETLALLEGYGYDGEVSAFVTASGGAAIFMATQPFLVNPDHQPINLVAPAHLYGGTFQLFNERYRGEYGVEIRWVKDPGDINEWASNVDAQTRLIFGEMPSNPTLRVMPIREVADLAHAHGIPFVIDATIATPALMRPLCHGADVVVHSVTKSMAANGLVLAGAVIARHNIPSKVGTDELRANFAHYVKWKPFRDYGPGLSPFNALMALNDLRTLRQRMNVVSRSSMRVAEFLDAHPGVEAVYYPGVASAVGHAIAKQYMWLVDGEDDYGEAVNRYGHLLSFTVKGGAAAARAFFDRLNMIWRATDLGRIKSVATIPAISTHQQQGEAGRDLAQIPPNLIRLNVGGEHPADIMDDLAQALDF